jgi:hypothetical protein
VVDVPVAAHDGLDGARVDAQAAHVLGDAVRAGAGVEQQPVIAPGPGHRDQHREAVLGDQDVGRLPAGHDAGRPPQGGRAGPDGRALAGHQGVGDVVHERGDHDRVDRLQPDLDGRLEVVQHGACAAAGL